LDIGCADREGQSSLEERQGAEPPSSDGLIERLGNIARNGLPLAERQSVGQCDAQLLIDIEVAQTVVAAMLRPSCGPAQPALSPLIPATADLVSSSFDQV